MSNDQKLQSNNSFETSREIDNDFDDWDEKDDEEVRVQPRIITRSRSSRKDVVVFVGVC